MILESDRPIISDSKGWYLLRQMLPWEVAEQLKGCKRCMDEQKCIFDAPEHLVQKILQVRGKMGFEGMGVCYRRVLGYLKH